MSSTAIILCTNVLWHCHNMHINYVFTLGAIHTPNTRHFKLKPSSYLLFN